MKILFFLIIPFVSFSQFSLTYADKKIPTIAYYKDEISIPVDSVNDIVNDLWNKHINEQKKDLTRKHEIDKSYVEIDGVRMNFSLSRKGKKPSEGYPLYIALHGGGGAPGNVNDEQWEHMKYYYLNSIDTGIYIAPRGISNNWNLHFESLSYPLYDRIIDNLILNNEINPNKIFILGFSAGGDGVYQIAPRMADRLAGANMSAGHPNGTSAVNLFTVPFMIQMGENDAAYDRNKEAAVYHLKLEFLRSKQNKGYINELFLHDNGTHNSPWRDNNPNPSEYAVITNAKEWYNGLDKKLKKKDSNAVRCLNKFTRTPHPNHLIWESNTRANSRGLKAISHYWLSSTNPKGTIEVSFDNNTFIIHQSDEDFTIWIDPKLVDISKKVIIINNSKEIYNQLVAPNINSIAKSIMMKNDPELIYIAEIPIKINN
ncbi:MAG: hypothetical protein MK207_08950 [Saprospiraceae bacterium]|nr:hypothetical protein [Saprospiraceae bacterium]